jgi:hypothetical protein
MLFSFMARSKLSKYYAVMIGPALPSATRLRRRRIGLRIDAAYRIEVCQKIATDVGAHRLLRQRL